MSMAKRVLERLLASILLLPFICNYIMAQNEPFLIVITASHDMVKAGSDIRLKVQLTNTSVDNVALARSGDGSSPIVAGSELDVIVRGADGALAPETRYERERRGQESPTEPYITSGIVTALSPGESSTGSILLNKFYDLSHPGKYSIQLQWVDSTGKLKIESNIVMVTIVNE